MLIILDVGRHLLEPWSLTFSVKLVLYYTFKTYYIVC